MPFLRARQRSAALTMSRGVTPREHFKDRDQLD